MDAIGIHASLIFQRSVDNIITYLFDLVIFFLRMISTNYCLVNYRRYYTLDVIKTDMHLRRKILHTNVFYIV